MGFIRKMELGDWDGILFEVFAMRELQQGGPKVTSYRDKWGEISNATKNTLGGGFKDILFSPLFGEDSHFD